MMGLRGLVTPSMSRIGILIRHGICEPRMKMSLAVTAVARIRTRSSSSLGTGFGISLSCKTSGGPYFVQTNALMPCRGARTAPHEDAGFLADRVLPG